MSSSLFEAAGPVSARAFISSGGSALDDAKHPLSLWRSLSSRWSPLSQQGVTMTAVNDPTIASVVAVQVLNSKCGMVAASYHSKHGEAEEISVCSGSEAGQ